MRAGLSVTLIALLVSVICAEPPVSCPPEDGEDVVLLPNPEDCASFYSCANGIPYLMQCSAGLHFNADERVCDWPENAGCELSTLTPDPTESTTIAE